MPDVNSFVKKTNYNTKVAEINIKLSSLDGKITKNKNELTKNTINAILFFWEIWCLIVKVVLKLI